ncbi:hypothetical protein BDV96DRAFT_329300 [Lophiotrema nucula]|uniref:Uncharacterized protein n=1 Tax=Lophiotrema nucula TaxID=690887 RepID=A0A6A5YIA6_9PLEO|nr:hypothetical protein BDV96DRAFT_329300 [Lophiotrema nucula]
MLVLCSRSCVACVITLAPFTFSSRGLFCSDVNCRDFSTPRSYLAYMEGQTVAHIQKLVRPRRRGFAQRRREELVKRQSMSSRSLLSLLRRFRGRKASDPRDKVYALLSLVGTVRAGSEIVLDCSMTVAETFQKATLECIYTSQSLSVLATDLERKFTPGLPSWVAPGGYGTSGRADALGLYTACAGTNATAETVNEL